MGPPSPGPSCVCATSNSSARCRQGCPVGSRPLADPLKPSRAGFKPLPAGFSGLRFASLCAPRPTQIDLNHAAGVCTVQSTGLNHPFVGCEHGNADRFCSVQAQCILVSFPCRSPASCNWIDRMSPQRLFKVVCACMFCASSGPLATSVSGPMTTRFCAIHCSCQFQLSCEALRATETHPRGRAEVSQQCVSPIAGDWQARATESGEAHSPKRRSAPLLGRQ